MVEQLNSSELLDRVFDVDFMKFIEMCEEVLQKDVAFDEVDLSYYMFDKGEKDYSRLICCSCGKVMDSSFEDCPVCGLYTNSDAYVPSKKEMVSDGHIQGAEYANLTELTTEVRKVGAVEFTCVGCGNVSLSHASEKTDTNKITCSICGLINSVYYTLPRGEKR